ADSPNTTGISSLWRSRRKGGSDIAQAADEAGEAVGLYLTGQQAFLARVRSSRNRFPVVSEHLAVTLDPQPDQAAEELRDHLRMIGGGRMPRRLWTCLQSPGMVLQALRVPQVRASAMASAAFWTLKKERNLETEDTVFDIERLRTVDEDGVTRNELLAVAVPKDELAEHQQLIAAMGTETAGICPPVFAFRNYLRLGYPELSRRPCAVLFVNDASSDVFVFQAGQILAVRTLRTGLDSLRDTIAQTLDIDAGDPRADACLKLLAGEAVDVSVFGDDAPPSAEDVFSWGRPVARRLARNIQRTLHAFEDTLEGSEAASFFVSGTITRYQPLLDFLGEQMGLVLTPFTPTKSEFLQDVVEEGEPPPEESGMSLAVGLALAESYHTPNLLFTYEDRQKLQRRTAIARAVRVSVAVLLIILATSTVALRFYVGVRRGRSKQLQRTVAKAAEVLDEAEVTKLARQVAARQMSTRGLAEAYYAPGVVAEVSDLTPDSVHLLEIHVGFAAKRGKPAVG
ncbi:MAG: hypothetical protein HN849_32475, partial [Victivallales bacterium]|nr:hypothetical protein [Victivallales bacterium]